MSHWMDSAVTFSQHISDLICCFYFQLSLLKRLRTISKAVSIHIFTSSVLAFVCSRIYYFNILC